MGAGAGNKTMNPIEVFERQKSENIQKLGADQGLRTLGLRFLTGSAKYKYSYNFSWLGRPIIQLPQDILAMQEIIWQVQPELIVETGIAHGGSLIFFASMLELIGRNGKVLGVDIEIRTHNRQEIERHRLASRINLLQGSSIDPDTVAEVHRQAQGKKVLLVLDSNHTHSHVLQELSVYSPLVKKGSYIVVCDTSIEDLPADFFPDRPWNKGNNPKTAVHEFLRTSDRFLIDRDIDNKLLISVAYEGYLLCVKD